MSMNPRIEEVSDSDLESDPSEMDPSDFAPNSIIAPANIPSTTASASTARAPPPQDTKALHAAQDAALREARERTKRFQCLYPVYFDATRSRAEGRRVNKADGVANPLARTIIDALQSLLLPGGSVAFEPTKMHPKDWANPGRVRVQLRDADGRDTTGGRIKSKNDLLNQVAAYLKAHPTTADSPLRLKIPGVPLPEDGIPAVHVPRGFRIGSVVPLHSPALSGGGVKDNMMQEMMKEMQSMQGQGGANPLAGMANMLGGLGGMGGMPGGGMPALPQGGQAAKKEKKKAKK